MSAVESASTRSDVMNAVPTHGLFSFCKHLNPTRSFQRENLSPMEMYLKEFFRMTFMLFHRWWKSSLLLAFVLLFIGGLITLSASPLAHARPSPVASLQTPTLRVLFDNAHTETAGNADWVISSSQPDPLGENPNPQKETDWTGGISAWGVTLQKTGRYSLMTNTGALTYGISSNPLDLS